MNMSAVIKTKLVRIGNSRGIRVPRVLVEQAGLEGELELEVRHKRLIVRSAATPRQGWEERFREMSRRGHDRLLWPEAPPTSFDEKEWKW
jgi:antitoxin MazE